MTISAQIVKDLREKTGVGMMDCKKALEISKGDFDAAIKYLREKGLASASKKAERETKEGRVFSLLDDAGKKGIILEINCETDFVANNQAFIDLGNKIVKVMIDNGNVKTIEDLNSLIIEGKKLADVISEAVLKLGENIGIKRLELINTTGILANYIHSNGRIGVVVNFSAEVDKQIAKDIAMHIAAMNPLYISSENIPQEEVAKEKEIIKAQTLNEGKPAQVVDKIVEGRVIKYFKESCLLDQIFVKDNSKAIKDIIPKESQISQFIRYSVKN